MDPNPNERLIGEQIDELFAPETRRGAAKILDELGEILELSANDPSYQPPPIATDDGLPWYTDDIELPPI